MYQTNQIKTDQIAVQLIAYLRAELDDSTIAYDYPLTQLQGGIETATYQFQLKGAKELDGRLVLRLYPEYRNPKDAAWESSVQNALADAGYPVPRAYLVCTDKTILGGVFFIMEFRDGKPMLQAHEENWPELLGKVHATLHKIDPNPLINSFNEKGFDQNWYRKDIMDDLEKAQKEGPWIHDIADWLIKNCPPEPENLALCHNDFHPYNILLQDGKVTGVLDWHLSISDPTLDVASTIQVLTVKAKHLSGSKFAAVDWERGAQVYLDAYRAQIPLDSTNLNYYRVLQCLGDLYGGLWNHELRHPLIVRDSTLIIQEVTGIRITMPD
jgi:aminoglycoside phosphotransferase (APT) family kinase protein